MFNYSYNYKMDATKSVITLSPTKSTWMKALAPSLVLGAGFLVMTAGAAVQEKLEQRNNRYPDPEDT